MKKILIRKIEDKDLERAIEIINVASLPSWLEDHLSHETIKKLKRKTAPGHLKKRTEEGHFFVAVDEEKDLVVGIMGLRKDKDVMPNRISTFYIDPTYQKQMIGRALFNAVFNKAKELQFKKLIVGSSRYAEPIYKHFGFNKVGIETKKYPDGSSHDIILMQMYI